jgi:hypothetical protein
MEERDVKKAFSVALGLAMALVAVLPAAAGQDVELTGWITDEWCGARNANAEGAGCAKACAKKGAELVLATEGKLYKLSDKELALEHVGYKVTVKGTLEDDTLDVTSIEKAKEDA